MYYFVWEEVPRGRNKYLKYQLNIKHDSQTTYENFMESGTTIGNYSVQHFVYLCYKLGFNYFFLFFQVLLLKLK